MAIHSEEIVLSPQALGLLSMLEGAEEKGQEWSKIAGPQKDGRYCTKTKNKDNHKSKYIKYRQGMCSGSWPCWDPHGSQAETERFHSG